MNRRGFIRHAGVFGAAFSMPRAIFAEARQARQVPTRPIPSSGEPLPILGFGNSQSFRAGDYSNAKKLLDVLLEMGGSFVDTDGISQVVLGQYMGEHRAQDKLFLGTNIGANDWQDGLDEIDRSREIQGKKVLDLLQLPRPTDIENQWRLMQGWKDSGRTRYIGIAIARDSYYDMIESLIRSGTLDFVQLNYSMLEPESGDRLLPLAQDEGVAVVTNRPFINGEYFPLVSGKVLPAWAAEFDCHSWAQFSLKYILANPAVNCVLTETTKTEHAVDNLSAGFGRLPDEKTRMQMLRLVRSF
ncbi:MAG: aldo/keto reductase [Woeseia sp.]